MSGSACFPICADDLLLWVHQHISSIHPTTTVKLAGCYYRIEWHDNNSRTMVPTVRRCNDQGLDYALPIWQRFFLWLRDKWIRWRDDGTLTSRAARLQKALVHAECEKLTLCDAVKGLETQQKLSPEVSQRIQATLLQGSRSLVLSRSDMSVMPARIWLYLAPLCTVSTTDRADKLVKQIDRSSGHQNALNISNDDIDNRGFLPQEALSKATGLPDSYKQVLSSLLQDHEVDDALVKRLCSSASEFNQVVARYHGLQDLVKQKAIQDPPLPFQCDLKFVDCLDNSDLTLKSRHTLWQAYLNQGNFDWSQMGEDKVSDFPIALWEYLPTLTLTGASMSTLSDVQSSIQLPMPEATELMDNLALTEEESAFITSFFNNFNRSGDSAGCAYSSAISGVEITIKLKISLRVLDAMLARMLSTPEDSPERKRFDNVVSLIVDFKEGEHGRLPHLWCLLDHHRTYLPRLILFELTHVIDQQMLRNRKMLFMDFDNTILTKSVKLLYGDKIDTWLSSMRMLGLLDFASAGPNALMTAVLLRERVINGSSESDDNNYYDNDYYSIGSYLYMTQRSKYTARLQAPLHVLTKLPFKVFVALMSTMIIDVDYGEIEEVFADNINPDLRSALSRAMTTIVRLSKGHAEFLRGGEMLALLEQKQSLSIAWKRVFFMAAFYDRHGIELPRNQVLRETELLDLLRRLPNVQTLKWFPYDELLPSDQEEPLLTAAGLLRALPNLQRVYLSPRLLYRTVSSLPEEMRVGDTDNTLLLTWRELYTFYKQWQVDEEVLQLNPELASKLFDRIADYIINDAYKLDLVEFHGLTKLPSAAISALNSVKCRVIEVNGRSNLPNLTGLNSIDTIRIMDVAYDFRLPADRLPPCLRTIHFESYINFGDIQEDLVIDCMMLIIKHDRKIGISARFNNLYQASDLMQLLVDLYNSSHHSYTDNWRILFN